MILTPDNLPLELRGENINVVLIDMETGISEEVNQNKDGSYTIFLNSKLSYDMQYFSFAHAAKHIISHDWDKEDVQEIELSHEKDSYIHPSQL